MFCGFMGGCSPIALICAIAGFIVGFIIGFILLARSNPAVLAETLTALTSSPLGFINCTMSLSLSATGAAAIDILHTAIA